jgi:hypothetical protein
MQATSAIATAACPAAGRYGWHRPQCGGAEGGARPVDLVMHATAARPGRPREHHRLRRDRTGVRAAAPLTGPAHADQIAREGRVT